MARIPTEALIERSKMALAKITAAMARNDPPPWPYVARIFFAPPKTWPTGPIAARARELQWLVKRYGLPMPRGPFQSVRPRSALAFFACHRLGSLALFCGGSAAVTLRVMLGAVERIDGYRNG